MFELVLYHPQIAPNTGNIIRLCANSGCKLHLIEPLGFTFTHKQLRRAGLDYHALAEVKLWRNWQEFRDQHINHPHENNAEQVVAKRVISFSTRHVLRYSDFRYQPGDILLFGSETDGLPDEVRAEIAEANRLHIPMRDSSRSLNLSNSVSIVVYEAWRQCDFAGQSGSG